MLLLFIACFGSSSGPDAGPAGSSLDTALEACRSKGSAVAVGRCSLEALRQAEAVTMKACVKMPGPRWQSECVMEASEGISGTLEERYAACSEAGDHEITCGFRQWQRDVDALTSGFPGGHIVDGILIRANQVFRQHRSYAEKLDYSYEEAFWAHFWGTWWVHLKPIEAGNTEPCYAWTDPTERTQCEVWAKRAHAWVESHSE